MLWALYAKHATVARLSGSRQSTAGEKSANWYSECKDIPRRKKKNELEAVGATNNLRGLSAKVEFIDDILPQNSEKSSGNAKYSLSEYFDIEQILFDDDFYSIYEKEDKSIINKSEAELQAELKAIDENYSDEDLVGEAKKRKLEDYKSNPQKYERLYEEQH